MSRYVMRIKPSWPWSVGQPGHVLTAIPVQSEPDLLELIRRRSMNAEHYEIVDLDAEGDDVA